MSSHPSRRTFLKVAGTSILASGLAPAFVHAESKSGNRPAVIGSGDWKFECHHNWGEVPDHIQWRDTHGVAVDKEGLIYISHRGNTDSDTVVVFDPQGKFVRSFGKEYAGGGHGIDIRDEGGTEYLYLSINAPHRFVVKCDKQGNVVWKQTAPDKAGIYDSKHAYSPTNVCFGPQGELFVGDGYGSHYLHQYDKDGSYVRSWGGPGAQAGQFKTPHGQWLDTRQPDRPLIVVADRANVRLQWLTLDGEPVQILQGVKDPEQHGVRSELKTEDGKTVPVTSFYGISFPASVDSQGESLLIADLHARVLVLNGKNELVSNLGFSEEWTAQALADKFKMRTSPEMWQEGKFVHPHDACFDQHGNIFVTEWVSSGRVTLLKRLG
ncbi:MAG TPA: peptidase [Planctomicrobium sp.]|nr:peptidase [Planctomicrobium sp.]